MTDGSNGGASDSGKAKVTTTCDLVPDLDEAIRFLQHWSPNEAIISTSVTEPGTGEKGNFETRQFAAPVDWDAVRKYIASHQRNGKWANIYFSVNPSNNTIGKKMSREDIGSMVALHVDVDVAPGEDQVEGIARIINVFQHYKVPPSEIVTSGGGAQAYWRLAKPEPINGDLTIAEDLKNYNRAIERDLEGDHCHNVDRIMRVPGTVNIPTKAKVAKGRVPALAHWYSKTAVTYDLGQFTKLPPENPAASAPLDLGGKFIDAGRYEPVRTDDARLEALGPKWKKVGAEGDTEGDFTGIDGKTDRSRMLLAFVTQALRAGLDDTFIASIIMDANWKVGECVRDKSGETKRQLKRVIERAKKFVDEDMAKPPVLGMETWTKSADKFIARVCPDLAYWNGDFYVYRDGVYHAAEEGHVRSLIRKFLISALIMSSDKTGAQIFSPFNPNNNDVNEMLGAVRDAVYLNRNDINPPCWRYEDATLPEASQCVNLRNGILHVPTRAFSEHSADFFTTSITTFDYDVSAKCPTWKQTLTDYWPNKPDGSPADEVLLLQEMFGYSITPLTYLQKIFALVGPGRSGKGTIGKILTALVGQDNVASPTLGSLSHGEFGIMPLLRKTLAIIGEAAFGRSDDRAGVTNMLKTISGEDDVTVNRKNKDHWIGKLLVRFWLFCNKIPDFEDAGKAFMMRLIPLQMIVSWAGKEDPNLSEKLAAEVAGIFNWALEGYDRLMRNKGKFTMPESTLATREIFGRLASPIGSFIEDTCNADSKCHVLEDDLYKVYELWIEKNGGRAKPKGKFIEDVVSFDPGKFKRYRPELDNDGLAYDSRPRAVRGLMLKRPAPKDSPRKQAHDDGQIPF